jgi:hypothetical protein
MPFGLFYTYLFPSSGGQLFIGYYGLALLMIGFIFSFLFFTWFIFSAFGGNKKRWLAGFLSLPFIIILVYLDFEHIYFPIIIGLIGWGLGLGVEKGLNMLKK